MKKSIKEQTINAFQTGGVVNPQTGTYQVPGTGITGFQQAPGLGTGYTPNQPIQPYFTPTQFTQAQYQDPLQVTNIPTFADTVGSGFGQYDEERTYINDAGQVLKIPFKDGKPLFPIPEGYSEQGAAPTEETPSTTIPLTGQTTTRDTGGGKEDTATVTPTTKAARNVYKGYSKGYAGLSTAFGSGTGGLSEAAAQAKKDFGITGQQTGNLGSLASFLMASAGVPIGIASLTAGKGGYLNDTPVTPGAIGTVSYQDLVAIANGEIPARAEDLVNQQTAKNVLEAQFNYGVNLSGKIGYNSGDINPVTGTPVKNGMAVNSAFGPGVTSPSYATVEDMKNVIQKGLAAGWRGGYIDKKAYDGLSAKAKENYNNFDNTHLQNDIISGNYKGEYEDVEDYIKDSKAAQEAYEKGNQPMQDNITGTPTSTDVDKAFAAADAAYEAGVDYGDEFGNIPESSYDGGGRSEDADAADAGRSDTSDSGSSCFAAGTKFFMADGSLKNIEDIKIGDILQKGGKVRTTMVGDGLYENWYMYGTTKVTGTHTVYENGTWKRVADSDKAIPTEKDKFIYTLVNEKHRLIAEDGVMYGDYDEVDNLDIEDGLLEMMNLQDSVDQAA